jgi:hypothetical protein
MAITYKYKYDRNQKHTINKNTFRYVEHDFLYVPR